MAGPVLKVRTDRTTHKHFGFGLIVLFLAPAAANADPWKDESGKGREQAKKFFEEQEMHEQSCMAYPRRDQGWAGGLVGAAGATRSTSSPRRIRPDGRRLPQCRVQSEQSPLTIGPCDRSDPRCQPVRHRSSGRCPCRLRCRRWSFGNPGIPSLRRNLRCRVANVHDGRDEPRTSRIQQTRSVPGMRRNRAIHRLGRRGILPTVCRKRHGRESQLIGTNRSFVQWEDATPSSYLCRFFLTDRNTL